MFIGTSAMSWSDANEYCLGLGRNLISIHSDDDNVAAARLCLSVDHTSSYGCWIGLYDSGSHEYIWSDGSKSDYGFNESTGDPSYAFPWSTNEPSSTGEDCIHIWSNSDQWNDLTCTWSAYPLCKGAPSASPTMDPTSFPTTDPTVDTSTDALISWHCDDSSKLFVSRDRGTSWERQPVFSAPYSEVAVRGNNIVNISIDDSMHYAMDITVHSIPDNWVSVFQCGNSINDHYPTIWMSGSSGTANATYEGFYTSWSNAGSHGKFLEEGQTYHLEVIVNQSWLIVQVDGLATYSSAVSEHETFENVPCYLSNPWYTAAVCFVSGHRLDIFVITVCCWYDGSGCDCIGYPDILWCVFVLLFSTTFPLIYHVLTHSMTQGGDSSKSSSVLIEDIDPSTDIIRVHCDNSVSWGGFAATVNYQFTDYSTTNPIDDGAWTLVPDESISSSLDYYGPASDPPSIWTDTDLSGIADDAYWIWGDDFDIGTMVFEMRFSSTTDEPTTASPTTAEPTTAEPTTAQSTSGSPSAEPIMSPSNEPTASPTANHTTGWPTISEVIKRSATMHLNAAFSDLEFNADDNDMTNEELAEMIVESAMNLDSDSSLSNVDITIIEVREGSVIIDYTLESAVDGVVALALDNIEDTVGHNITILYGFVLTLEANTMISTTGEPEITNDAQETDTAFVSLSALCSHC